MILQVGKAGKARFIYGMKKTNVFECGDMGVVMEREGRNVMLYATNAQCSEIYCRANLGPLKNLKKYKQVVIAYNDHVMLVDAGEILVVIDYDAEKIAINKDDIVAKGSKFWGDEVQEPWLKIYGRMFGMDEE